MSMKYIVAGATAMVTLGLIGFMSFNDIAPPARHLYQHDAGGDKLPLT